MDKRLVVLAHVDSAIGGIIGRGVCTIALTFEMVHLAVDSGERIPVQSIEVVLKLCNSPVVAGFVFESSSNTADLG